MSGTSRVLRSGLCACVMCVQLIETGKATLEDCEAFIKEHGEPQQRSGQQEKYECILNTYC